MNKNYKVITFCLSILIIFCSAKPHPFVTIEDKNSLSILTPTFKDRTSTKIRLKNGLEAYLISDPNADKSSAALVVKTGSWEDPEEAPGLAHFTEHMLFMGTKKYPNESEYLLFMNEHGGKTNAFTSTDTTGYLFSIDNNAIVEALDRFSNFFIEPLFAPSAVEKELNAIEQEYAKNLESDDRREHYVLKALANPNHPFNTFSAGNKKSLANVSQESLKKWYLEHYSANRMRLEIISTLPIEELTTLVVDTFSAIPNRNIQPVIIDMPLYKPYTNGHLVYIEPKKNVRRLTINWEVPKQFIYMGESKPEEMLGYLLEQDGEHGLLALLKQKGLANDIKAGSEKLGNQTYTFYLNIYLTDYGVTKLETVIMHAFEALTNLKRQNIPPYLYEEMATMRKLHYQYPSRQNAFEHIMKEAFNIGERDLATYPENINVITDFDTEAVQNLAAALKPADAIYTLLTPKYLIPNIDLDRQEPWMGTPYAIRPILNEVLEAWTNATINSDISLPLPNPYIPKGIGIQKPNIDIENIEIPNITPLLDDDRGVIYFSEDALYGVPMVSWLFEIKTPAIIPTDPKSHVMRDIFIKYIMESLHTHAYAAGIAGLYFDIIPTDNGIAVAVNGFSEKAKELFIDVIMSMKSLSPSPHEFDLLKQRLHSIYHDMALGSPLSQLRDLTHSHIYKEHVTVAAKSIALQSVTYRDLKLFANNVFQQTYIEGIMYGNTKLNEAQNLADSLLENLNGIPYPPTSHHQDKIVSRNKPQSKHYNSKSQGNAAILTIQCDDDSLKTWAAQQVLMQLIEQPFFAELRTQQQTGYLVLSRAEEHEHQFFNTFVVQSSTHEASDLHARFERFLESFLRNTAKEEITKSKFLNIKNSLLTALKTSPKNVSEMASHLQKLAFYERDFNKTSRKIAALQALTFEEFIESTQKILGKSNGRRLAIGLSFSH